MLRTCFCIRISPRTQHEFGQSCVVWPKPLLCHGPLVSNRVFDNMIYEKGASGQQWHRTCICITISPRMQHDFGQSYAVWPKPLFCHDALVSNRVFDNMIYEKGAFGHQGHRSCTHWGLLGPLLGHLGPLGAILGPLGAILIHRWPVMRDSESTIK